MFCTEAVVNTLVFANINGIILLLEVLFFRWMLDGKSGHQWWAGVAVGLSLVVKPLLAPLLLLPLLNRQWRVLGHRGRGAGGVQPGGDAVGRRPDELLQADAAVHPADARDYFNSSISGNGLYYGLPMWLIVLLRIIFALLAVGVVVAAVPLLPHPRSVVLVHAPRRVCC